MTFIYMNEHFNESNIVEKAIQTGFEVISKHKLPAKEPQYKTIPPRLNPEIKSFLLSQYPNGLYKHQAEAIDAFLDGSNVCISTSTASGKSLIFMISALNLILENPNSKVLALYPVRALIQDQIKKWETIVKPFNINVGYIDGGVPIVTRSEIIRSSNIILMTPDVAHAWLMRHLGDNDIKNFILNIRLLILDEAHVYDGVFGTNMAYFIRRFQIVTCNHQIICSTATLGKPEDFIYQLTGKITRSFDINDDFSAIPPKTILLLQEISGNNFESIVNFLIALAETEEGRFLAFGDSRKMVERIVASIHRNSTNEQDDNIEGDNLIKKILPYRSGYETEDRTTIQTSLENGVLIGVVSTSAMELGIDIGEIDLIILLDLPPTIKSFWQRIGRAGRKKPGICIVIDSRGNIIDRNEGLNKYLESPLEPNWLYLENRYIQYANALCAAYEINELGLVNNYNKEPYKSLPSSFNKFLENELYQTEIIPTDLYPLKQRAQAGPHREFPIRTGIETGFQVKEGPDRKLGNLTFSQALREAYPGAIYHYMARPYRIYHFNLGQGEIFARRDRGRTTKPISQTMVFPRFNEGILNLYISENGFLAETELQVSERVTGFIEQRGPTNKEYLYGPISPYYQRDLNRFFPTTGVCFCFNNYTISEKICLCIIEAFCIKFGIQERDLGNGLFFSNFNPIGSQQCRGTCIFDSSYGSLRLTQSLADNIRKVLDEAIYIAKMRGEDEIFSELINLSSFVEGLKPVNLTSTIEKVIDNWVTIIKPGQKAIYIDQNATQEVTVINCTYTPQGLMYKLQHQDTTADWYANATNVQPLFGETILIQKNFLTGEIKNLE